MRSSISGLKCLIRPWKTHPQPVSTTAYTALHYILRDYIHTFMQILLELGCLVQHQLASNGTSPWPKSSPSSAISLRSKYLLLFD